MVAVALLAVIGGVTLWQRDSGDPGDVATDRVVDVDGSEPTEPAPNETVQTEDAVADEQLATVTSAESATPAVTLPPLTTTTTTTLAPTTTTTLPPTTTTVPVDPETAALQQLDTYLVEDAQQIAPVLDRWVPQLSAKRLGIEWEGVTYDYQAILADHLERREPWGALLADGEAYNFLSSGEPMVGWFITIVPVPFETAEGAIGWCQANGFDRENCLAKLISENADLGNTTVLMP